MSFPVLLDPTTPANSESPSLGAARIRAIIQALRDLWQLPESTAAALTITRVGPLTNSTGVTLNAGDVVALDPAVNTSVALADAAGLVRPFVVALETITNAATGVFGQIGQVTVTVQGAVTRGNFLRKSATTKALEDTGVAQGSPPPPGTVGAALTGAAGPGAGTVVALLFGDTSRATLGGSRVSGLRGANNTGTPNSLFDLAADQIELRQPSDGSIVVRTNTGTLTTNVLTAGPAANGRDQAGVFAVPNFVHFYFIWNGTTLATLASLTAPPTGPTLPTGYTHWAYAGSVLYNASPVLVRTLMRGNRMLTVAVTQTVNAGAPAANTETLVDASGAAPPIALAFILDVSMTLTNVDTSGFTLRHRVVTGSDVSLLTGAVLAAGIGAINGQILIPYVGGAYWYLWTVDTPNTPVPVIFEYLVGFVVPNGDA